MDPRFEKYRNETYFLAVVCGVTITLTKNEVRPIAKKITGLSDKPFFPETIVDIAPTDVAYGGLIVLVSTLVFAFGVLTFGKRG